MRYKRLIIWISVLLAMAVAAFAGYRYGDRMCRTYFGKPLSMEVVKEQLTAMTEGAEIPEGKWQYGIDISHHQPIVMWGGLKVLLDENRMTVWNRKKSVTELPIDYIIMKASEGESFKDWRFRGRWKKADKYGYKRGAYHFFRPGKSAVDQAQNYIRRVGELDTDDLPPVLDIERLDDYSKDTLNNRALEWLQIVEKHYGRKPIIYANPHYLNNIIDPRITQNYPIWVANYKVSRPAFGRWQYWQFTDRALVRGVGCVDLNVKRK